MSGIPLHRRVALAAAALLLAGGLFRGQLASALITRGDDGARNGDPAAAARYYSRALALDPRSSGAADRLAFALTTGRRADDARTAIAVTTAALERTPNNVPLLADRGLAEQRLGRWESAERDFALAGACGRDARYDHLAGRIALRLHDRVHARRYFALALVHDPGFNPARAALERL
jgi:tetratricopeptide (TPR) repeat protein